jgi:hypothetical protein
MTKEHDRVVSTAAVAAFMLVTKQIVADKIAAYLRHASPGEPAQQLRT